MSQDSSYSQMILEHFRKQAEEHGASMRSTMEDDIVREKELELIGQFFCLLKAGAATSGPRRVLDMGCGNGCALMQLSESHGDNEYWGADFSDEMLDIARRRKLSNCEFVSCDARSTPFEDGFFDVVFTERCLINILKWEDQMKALLEISRILKPDGYYLMIECFTDGLRNNNKARMECGMPELDPAYHNLYLEKDRLFESIGGVFRVARPEDIEPNSGGRLCQSNFLSSHYFVARVLHPLATKGEFVRNTEFVRFFSSLLPPTGNYSPIQAHILAKEG